MSAASPIPAIKVAGGGLVRVTTLVVHQSGEPPVQRCGHVSQLDVAKKMAQVTFEDGAVEWIAGANLQRQQPRPAAAKAPAPTPAGPAAHADGRAPAVKVGNGNARVGTLVELTQKSLLTKKTRKGRVTKLGMRHAVPSAEVTFDDGAVEWVEAARLMRQHPQTSSGRARAPGVPALAEEPTAELSPTPEPAPAGQAAPQEPAAVEASADRATAEARLTEENTPADPTAEAVAVEETAPEPVAEAQAAAQATMQQCTVEEPAAEDTGSQPAVETSASVLEAAGPAPPHAADSKSSGIAVLAC